MKAAFALLGGVAVLILAGGAFFSYYEHMPYGDGLYFAIVTAFTVGYGDVIPHTGPGRVVAVVLMSTTIPAMAAIFARLTAIHSVHVWHRRHGRQAAADAQAARRIAADLYLHHTGTAHPDAPQEVRGETGPG